MSWIDRLSEEKLRELLIDGVEELVVFTGRSNQTQNLNCNWSYEIVGKNPFYGEWFTVKKISEWEDFCSCGECEEFGFELHEHFSILQSANLYKRQFSTNTCFVKC